MERRRLILFALTLAMLCSCTDSDDSSTRKLKHGKKVKTANAGSGTGSGTSSTYISDTNDDTGSGSQKRDDDILFTFEKKSPKKAFSRYLPGINPKRATLPQLMNAGEKAMADKDYESAISIGDLAIAKYPNKARGYSLRGRAAGLSIYGGRDDAALEDLAKANEIGMGTGAGSGRAYEGIAKIYSFRKQHERALEIVNKAIEVEPTEHDYYKLRAAIHRELKMPEKALEDYNLCIAVNPKNPTSHFTRAKFLEAMQQYDKALEDYAFVIEAEKRSGKSGRTVVSRKFRAEIFSHLKKHKEAIEELTAALEIEHNDDELLLMRGREYEKLKKYKEAEQDFSTAISNAPEFAAGAHEARAALYEKMGKKDLAASDRTTAKQLRSKPAERPLF